ncbi:MAG: CBS domain-containing protein [Lachnospiraceae bacterium]|nr:CBS domain-containing protein [Lachnospiraceae bacterium]
MNILFFLIPKTEVKYVFEDFTLRQVMERWDQDRFAAIPMLNRQGIYLGTISEGDLLRAFKHDHELNLQKAEKVRIFDIPRDRTIQAVPADSRMEDLVDLSLQQNFVPVVDDKGVFIGIITRKSIIEFLYKRVNKLSEELAAVQEQP